MPIARAVVCPVCGALCDDIELTIKKGKITDIRNGCALSEAKFLGYDSEHRVRRPLIRQNGQFVETSIKSAIGRAGEILAKASYPLLYGWSSTSCEAASVGIALAEEVGGVIDNTSTVCHGPSTLSVQEVGIPTCTLGQVRHRADLIIYWGSDPWSAHPRHVERYTMFSEGRFEKSEWRDYLVKTKASTAEKKVERATERVSTRAPAAAEPRSVKEPCPAILKKGRRLIVVDVRRTRTAEIADYFIKVRPNEDYELLQALRALVKDQEIEADEVAGVPVKYLEEIADALISCNFGMVFFGLGLTMSSGKLRNVDAALSLVRDLNARTKFSIMPMRGHFNVSGVDTVSTWQTGYPYAVDFSQGYPRYNPGETSAVDILLRRESDAALVVASDPASNFPRQAVEHLARNPLVVIDPHMSATAWLADIVIPSALVGIEARGTAYRMDHVPLPLKKVVRPPRGVPSDEQILRRLILEVRKVKKQTGES